MLDIISDLLSQSSFNSGDSSPYNGQTSPVKGLDISPLVLNRVPISSLPTPTSFEKTSEK